ncbi:MAG: DUF3566 domain-containing protein [Actinomycetales bacterium]|nr:DUF3566 domain-containing protein [Actinomycetales bacterium]
MAEPATRPPGQQRVSGFPRSPDRAVRRVRVRLARISPLSVITTVFLISIVYGLGLLFAAWLVWWLADSAGVLLTANQLVTDVFGTGVATFNFTEVVSLSRVMGVASIVAVVQVVAWTVIGGVIALLYNAFSLLAGGIEVTLDDDV